MLSSRISRYFLLLLFHCIALTAFSQKKHTLSGSITDAKNGEEIIGATVYIPQLGLGAISNAYGYYSVSLPPGKYNVEFSYVGYDKITREIDFNSDTRLAIELKETHRELKEVTVTADREEQKANVQQNKMSVVKIDIKQVRKIPILLGEVDVIKALQLLPGIQAAGDGNTLSVIRGGNIDHNLVLLDEAVVYNPSHVVGIFSVFNGDAIKDFEIYKGGIPAQYGGRLSSVLDIRMKDGNSKQFETSGGIGLLSSRLNFEGPIKKGKGSFIVSGRRTYFDLFLKFSDKTKNTQAYFYDLNVKANYNISAKDKLFLSGYFGQDRLGLSTLLGFGWNNTTATARWNHLFNSRLFSNTSFIFSNYNYDFDLLISPSLSFRRNNFIRDYSLKSDYNYYISPKSTLKFGVSFTHHTFQPGRRIALNDLSNNLEASLQEKRALEQNYYINHTLKPSSFITLDYGIRYSIFSSLGGIREYQYQNNQTTYMRDGVVMPGIVTSTREIASGLYNTYQGFEPRLNITFLLNSESSIKASYNKTYQYLHLIQSTTSSTGQEFWIPSDRYIKPQIGEQYAMGYFRNFMNNKIEASVEVYQKTMQNTPEIIDNANLDFTDNIESQIKLGQGRAMGIEFFIRKQSGRTTGWIGYTLAKSERKADGINNNEWYAYRFDRRHYLTAVISHELTENLSISGNFIYATGNAYTGAIGQYESGGKTVTLYGARNSLRVPDYHRMDVSLIWKREPAKIYTSGYRKYIKESNWVFSIYNVYGRKNVYSIDYMNDTNNVPSVFKTYLFTFVPSVTYNFKF